MKLIEMELPIALSFLRPNELTIVLKNEVRACVSKLQRQGSGIIKSSKMIRSEAVSQSVVRPILNFGRFPAGIEQLAIFGWRDITR